MKFLSGACYRKVEIELSDLVQRWKVVGSKSDEHKNVDGGKGRPVVSEIMTIPGSNERNKRVGSKSAKESNMSHL